MRGCKNEKLELNRYANLLCKKAINLVLETTYICTSSQINERKLMHISPCKTPLLAENSLIQAEKRSKVHTMP